MLAGCFILTSCKDQIKTPSMNDMSWIVGTWKSSDDSSSYTESWKKVNEILYLGEGGQSSKMELKQTGDGIFYVGKDLSQNDGKSASYKLMGTSADSLIFENPDYNFPKRLIYVKKPNNGLYIWADGKLDGQYQIKGVLLKRMQ